MSRSREWLSGALWLREDETPFPWQEQLLERFVRGDVPRTLDIPTGLGKTAVMAIWLVARAHGAPLPRRLVYVVDRRAVVDQATEVAEGLRRFVDEHPAFKHALGLEGRALPISTLRGQHVDNKDWLEDPASPAIIVGTVDMIGSRVLFEGYGTSPKMRPYHAGLLGADALVVLDEAHLVPPFERLLETIADGGGTFGARDEVLRQLVPAFRLISLSATGRVTGEKSFGLQREDLSHRIVRRRLDAAKRLSVLEPVDAATLADALAEHAWMLTDKGQRALRIIVFSDKREVAEKAKLAVDELAKGDKKQAIAECAIDTELFVGGRRVFERDLAARWLETNGFLARTKVARTQAAFVFATSAGEVGVDLDADHMVSDLVAWERMVQRVGRVNRRGDGDARVMVVPESPSKDVEKAAAKALVDRGAKDLAVLANAERLARVRELVCRLPDKDGARDASPGAICEIKVRAKDDPNLRALIDSATTPVPLRPALSRALVDAWSMTSLKEHTGRPEIEPWLRGWIKDDPPQTAVVWRTYLPVRTCGDDATISEVEAFFEAAPPHTSELLETETHRVVRWLAKRAEGLAASGVGGSDVSEDPDRDLQIRRDDIIAIAITSAGDVIDQWRPADLEVSHDKDANRKREDSLKEALQGATLIVDARIRGLRNGLLDEQCEGPVHTVDGGSPWNPGVVADSAPGTPSAAPVVRFRVILEESAKSVNDQRWRERRRFATEISDEGEPQRWLVVQKWREDAATEEDRSEGHPQLLGVHQEWAEERGRGLGHSLDLPDIYVEMLAAAARVHDEGKRTTRWQRAFNAAPDGVYAKTRGPINFARLDGYRHEFGSLPVAAKDARLRALPEDLYDLALHLIAAHHGFARPVIGINGCEEPPSGLEARARDVALRFARLQRRWGPWGLAWWESLLRAADQQASRQNDAADTAGDSPSVQENA